MLTNLTRHTWTLHTDKSAVLYCVASIKTSVRNRGAVSRSAFALIATASSPGGAAFNRALTTGVEAGRCVTARPVAERRKPAAEAPSEAEAAAEGSSRTGTPNSPLAAGNNWNEAGLTAPEYV